SSDDSGGVSEEWARKTFATKGDVTNALDTINDDLEAATHLATADTLTKRDENARASFSGVTLTQPPVGDSDAATKAYVDAQSSHFKGEWESATSYKANEQVTVDNALYTAVNDNVNSDPRGVYFVDKSFNP